MQLSDLQKFILKQTYGGKFYRISRRDLKDFYTPHPRPLPTGQAGLSQGEGRKIPSDDEQTNIITKSIERLIDREVLVGYGRRTPHKWFIEEVRLTPKGVRETKKLINQQQKLPFRKVKKLSSS